MIKKITSRRVFLQYLASTVSAAFLPYNLMASHPEKTSSIKRSYQHDDDSEFIIVDGWVLLKKDLEK